MKIRTFNKERRLRQLRRRRNNLIVKERTFVLSVFILALSIIYFTYARFDSYQEFEIVNATVVGISKTIYKYDNGNGSITTHKNPPEKEDGYDKVSVECKETTGKWDRVKWEMVLDEEVDNPSCTITFDKYNTYKEDILGSAPELYDGLVPITIESDGTIKIADKMSEWYSYENKEWANAVILRDSSRDKSVGDTLVSSEILQMYVWIPRYRYKLFNAELSTSERQMIEIEFESINDAKQSGSVNGSWLTHPAFTFGETELNGIWIAKYETSSTLYTLGNAESLGCVDENCENANTIRIKPNLNPLRNQDVSNMFYITRSIENQEIFNLNSNQIDTHLMKNMEWGALAYLTYSKYGRFESDGSCVESGCLIWHNSYFSNNTLKTGCSGTLQNASITTNCREWNNETYGGRASTTDNLYGIYDMAGASWEYVMGNVSINSSGYTFNPGRSGLVEVDSKYYDSYYSNSYAVFRMLKLGDATREIMTKLTNKASLAWEDRWACIPSNDSPWFARGGAYNEKGTSGVLNYGSSDGVKSELASWHIVLSER